jgi:predicted SAM-dependent methyltransferase
VGNEVTADEYIGFVLRKNPDARIWIIDLGEEQIIAVKKMVKSKYKGEDIIVKQVNALDLEKIVKLVSIDWIETDAVWEFFDYKSLKQLLDVWKKILKADGFVTTSATSYGGWWGRMVDQFKIWIGKKWLKVRVYSHERAKLHKLIRDSDYEFCERSTLMPYFRRYSMILR